MGMGMDVGRKEEDRFHVGGEDVGGWIHMYRRKGSKFSGEKIVTATRHI